MKLDCRLTRRQWMAGLAAARALGAGSGSTLEWIELFDGRSLKGWHAPENPGSWRVEGSLLVGHGPRSHLFYTGTVCDARFRNFELEVEAMLWPGANSGVFFHTTLQQSGWLARGIEVQLNNTYRPQGSSPEYKKTGSLYGVRNQYKSLVRDNEWFRVNVQVVGKNVRVRVNDVLVVDYTEPDPPQPTGDGRRRVLGVGTFALQAHDPGSRVAFRSIRVRPLPDDAPPPSDAAPPASDELARQILELSAQNYPVVDYHVHVREGMNLEEVLQRSRHTGIFYGLAVNCGLNFPAQNDEALRAYVEKMRGVPAFTALQAEGREWVTLVSAEAVGLFDYVFTDAMTWTDNRGRRMRLWVPAEVGTISDAQEFMETLVDRIVGIFEKEPIDIYANPTYLPAQLASRYDELWTEQRMLRVIRAARANDVAIEINTKRLPSEKFIRMAKEEGLKFTLGTNNSGPKDLSRCEYGLEIIRTCKLTPQDFWWPRQVGQRAVDRKGEALRKT